MTSCPPKQARSVSRALTAALVVWTVAVAAGFWALWSYASSPGRLDNPPESWPAESLVPHTAGRWTLVMFVHPRCPCTQASLAELERLQARSAGLIDLRIVSLLPPGTDSDWSDTPLSRRAALLPGALLFTDTDGHESRRFHAHTSGETLLYNPAGRLAYHGGITAARGHEGDNPGSDAIASLVSGGDAPTTCPAFGCPLFRDESPVREATP